jgi:hypothetical protein
VQITLSQALDILTQVGRGLRHLHGGGVLHRDLAARNVLKKRDGQCKVTDFGLSSVVSSTDAARMTSTTIGPVAWRAPETFHHDDAGRQVASVATDVYMLGGLLFEVLTAGRHAPFYWLPSERLMVVRATTSISTLDAAMAGGVSIPWAVVRGDDWTGAVDGVERLKGLMARCLHAESSRRPSMDDFLAELDAIRSPSPTWDSGYGGTTGTSPPLAAGPAPPSGPTPIGPRPPGSGPASAPGPPPAGPAPPSGLTPRAQLFDMNDASDAVAVLQVPADVLNRVCEAIADVADELGNVTGAQLLRIVVDEGVEASLAMALRRKLSIAAPVPRRRVRCLVAATSLRFWSLPCGVAASPGPMPRLPCCVVSSLRSCITGVDASSSMSRGAYAMPSCVQVRAALRRCPADLLL